MNCPNCDIKIDMTFMECSLCTYHVNIYFNDLLFKIISYFNKTIKFYSETLFLNDNCWIEKSHYQNYYRIRINCKYIYLHYDGKLMSKKDIEQAINYLNIL